MDVRALPVIALMIAASALALIVSDSSAEPVQLDPEERFPDADFIISDQYSDGKLRIAYKYYPADDGEFRWHSRMVNEKERLDVIKWSDMDRDISVVFESGYLRSLNLIELDDVSPTQKFVNIDFEMLDGRIDTFSVMKADPHKTRLMKQLGDDYDRMFNPIANATVSLESGRMGCFDPTSEMIYIDRLDVSVWKEMTVDRFYTSGENGRYGTIDVNLYGGTVGLMTNVKSRIGDVSYNLEHGSVDFFAVGSDTEFKNYSFDTPSTSFITGDIVVEINPSVRIGCAIIGGGATDMPNRLWNGDTLQSSTVRNIILDADGRTLLNDACFLNESRDKAYDLHGYILGRKTIMKPVSDIARISDGSVIPAYGEDGMWNGINANTLDSGTSFFIDTVIEVKHGGRIDIPIGSKLVITDRMILDGDLNVHGEVVNNGIIEVRTSGSVAGRVSGGGVVADVIQCSGPDVSVMSRFDTVILDGLDGSVDRLNAILLSGKASASIVSRGVGGMAFEGSAMLSLKEIDVSDMFATGYVLTLQGQKDGSLDGCTATISVPVPSPNHSYKVHSYNQADESYSEVETVLSEGGELVFRMDAGNGHIVALISESGEDLPEPAKEIDFRLLMIVVMMGAVTTASVYAIIRFRR